MGKYGGTSYFEDSTFQDELIHFLVHDRDFLRQASHLLTAEDFVKVGSKEGLERQTVAEVALKYFGHYRQPIGKFLKIELLGVMKEKKWDPGSAPRQRMLEYSEQFANGHLRVAPDAMLERVKQYKMEHAIAKAMGDMQELMEKGTLTSDVFLALSRKAVEQSKVTEERPIDFFDDKELESRLSRRMIQQRTQRFPVLLIDPIDRQIRIIARKHMGLVMAPYKRGKSLFFIWLALAYTLQGLNVLYVTLEDSKEDVEDRFDAAVTALPMSRLHEIPEKVREKFKRYKRLLRTRLKIFDGTSGGVSINTIESVWEQERNRGFTADAIIVDYDDEIKPPEKKSERRHEFAEIYRAFRAVLARHELIGWTASQTGRDTLKMKIISGKYIAEDVGKIRKASLALSLGAGEWGEKSIFMWVEAHRHDKDHVGANIMTDKDRMLFYDREETIKQEKIARAQKAAAAVTP